MGCFIERKTPAIWPDALATNGRDSCGKMRRGRYGDCLVVVIEGTLAADIPSTALSARLPAGRYYCPFVFAGSQRLAADFALEAPLPASFLPRSAAGLSRPGERSRAQTSRLAL